MIRIIVSNDEEERQAIIAHERGEFLDSFDGLRYVIVSPGLTDPIYGGEGVNE